MTIEERNEQIVQRFMHGEKASKLAEEFGVTWQTIYYVIKNDPYYQSIPCTPGAEKYKAQIEKLFWEGLRGKDISGIVPLDARSVQYILDKYEVQAQVGAEVARLREQGWTWDDLLFKFGGTIRTLKKFANIKHVGRTIKKEEPKKRKRGDIFDGAVLPFAAAIVERAVQDYKAALWDSKRKGRPTVEQRRLEAFFRSSWCETLTDINGEKIIQAVREREGYAI